MASCRSQGDSVCFSLFYLAEIMNLINFSMQNFEILKCARCPYAMDIYVYVPCLLLNSMLQNKNHLVSSLSCIWKDHNKLLLNKYILGPSPYVILEAKVLTFSHLLSQLHYF